MRCELISETSHDGDPVALSPRYVLRCTTWTKGFDPSTGITSANDLRPSTPYIDVSQD